MRRIALVASGCVIAVGFFTLGQQSHTVLGTPATAATSETYKHLSLFGDVFDKVRADYVDKVDERQLIENAVNGMTAWLGAQPIHLAAKSSKKPYIYLAEFGDIYDKLRADYAGKVDERQLIEKAIDGMLTSLDPRSSYLDAKAFKDARTPAGDETGGLGLEVTQEGGFVTVVAPIDDTPSARAGVMPGDLIAAINGETVQGWSPNQVVDKMRGAINSPVRLTILRGAERRKIDLKMVRERVYIKSVRARKQDDDIAYIRISRFDEETMDGLEAVIAKFQQDIPAEKFKGYILDLRNNPGGLLDRSIGAANAFLDKGEIVSTRGRNADETQRYSAQARVHFSKDKPVVVLINGGTASGSEIVTGALQDHKRATIIGTRSFGLGTVQTIIPLGGADGALRLTTARYYTPSGRSIQAKGIEPDIVVLQDVPDEFKGKDDVKGEDGKASLQGYVPPDEKKDKKLLAAIDFLRRAPNTRGTTVSTKTKAPN